MIVALALMFSGCATGHNSQYRNIDHLKYSMCGYKHTTQEDVEKSKAQGWYGKPVKCDKCKLSTGK